ncbi:MAG TPA: hypothetical protein VFJ61_05155 [Solirubrobacterales bacterium]|nr:hypothetical protein [Solirubrobacterales bacterium]
MRPGRVATVLAGLTLAAVTQLGTPAVDYFLLPLLVTLLATHVDRESAKLSRSIIVGASRLLPPHRRQDELDEWLDHVESAGEQGMQPLTRAITIALLSAPLLAVGLRVGRSRRRAG